MVNHKWIMDNGNERWATGRGYLTSFSKELLDNDERCEYMAWQSRRQGVEIWKSCWLWGCIYLKSWAGPGINAMVFENLFVILSEWVSEWVSVCIFVNFFWREIRWVVIRTGCYVAISLNCRWVEVGRVTCLSCLKSMMSRMTFERAIDLANTKSWYPLFQFLPLRDVVEKQWGYDDTHSS